MSTIVLVHGAWHAGWAWERIVPLLESGGHRVVVVDLPGHTEDGVPPSEVSLAGYAEHVAGVLDEQDEPAVLVGHSMGGIVISEAAERRPDAVRLLVYLTGFLLPDGVSLLETAQTDEEALVLPHAQVDEALGIVTVRDDMIQEIFYGRCPEEDVRRALARLVPQPLGPFVTPLSVSGENFGRVRRAYVECLEDRAISPATQKRMYTQLPCETVVSMQTDHSPFYSAPEELAGHLDALARA